MESSRRQIFARAIALCVSASMFLSSCATSPKLGGDDLVTKGASAGQKTVDAAEQLERCASPLGTVGLVDMGDPYVPIVQTIIQQSNCFIVVERGRAYQNVDFDRQLKQSNLLRSDSARDNQDMQVSQSDIPAQSPQEGLLGADYTLAPSITFAEPSGFALTTGLGGFFGRRGDKADTSAQVQAIGASATLRLIHNGSGAQIIAAQGSAKNYALGAGVGILGGLIAGVNAYANTPQGKIVAAALLDAYNKLVVATKQYEAQTATGAVGKGGALASP